jgi:hypothetical protein
MCRGSFYRERSSLFVRIEPRFAMLRAILCPSPVLYFKRVKNSLH